MASRHDRPNIYAMAALRRAYGVRLGKLGDLLSDREHLHAELDHIAAVIRMFDPGSDVDAIPAIRPRRPQGRWNRTALKILREANAPMRGRDLARRIMLAQGLDPSDHRRRCSIEASMQAVLLRLARMGLVQITGKPRRWSIARD